MLRDLELLKLMMQRNYYDNYSQFVVDETIQPETGVILQDFKAYYERFDKENEIDLSKFVPFFHQLRHVDLNKEDRVLFDKVFDNLKGDLNKDIQDDLLNKLKAQSLGSELLKVNETIPTVDKYVEIVDKHLQKEKLNTNIIEFVTDDIDIIIEELDPNKGHSWRIPALNTMLGKIQPGIFGVLGACSDVGKSSFLCSEMSNLCQQLDNKDEILWLNNENKGIRIKERLYQCMFNIRKDQLYENVQEYKKQFADLGGTKVKILDIHGQNYKYIEKLIKTRRPKVVLIDMMDHIAGFDAKNAEASDVKYDRMYQWGLNLACVYDCYVICTSQLNAEAEGKAYPFITSLKGANGSSKRGAATWVMFIGRKFEQGCYNIRYLYAPKTKLGVFFKAEVQFDNETGLFYTNNEGENK